MDPSHASELGVLPQIRNKSAWALVKEIVCKCRCKVSDRVLIVAHSKFSSGVPPYHCRKAQSELLRNTLRDATAARGRGAQISAANGISPSDMLAAAKLGRRRGVVEKVIKETFALVTLPAKTRGQTQREVRFCKVARSAVF